MTNLLNKTQLTRWAGWLWGLVLLTLPVTSFRYFPTFLGRSQMRPLALYPLVALWLVLLLLAWKERKNWRTLSLPRQLVPLALFLIFALFTTAVGALYAPLPLRGQTYLARAIRAWFSVGLGMAFFLAAIQVTHLGISLKKSLRWLYAGLALTILWGGVQALAINTSLLAEDRVSDWQTLFSMRPLIRRRVSGFAFEPSWLADQIVILYFPWLIASLFTGWRVSRWRWLEWGLLGGAGLLLLFTYSRSGLVNGVLVLALVFLFVGGAVWQRGWRWLIAPFQNKAAGGILLRIALLLIFIALISGALLWLNQYDYITRLWQTGFDKGLLAYLQEINAGARAANAYAGMQIYNQHPWTGSGLGSSGFTLYDYYPDSVLTEMTEVSRALSPDSNVFPNVKNLYIRLLAETGLPGFWLWIVFYLSLLGAVRQLLRSPANNARLVGIAGLFIWLAALFRNITQDSLTFPVMWVGLGVILGYLAHITHPTVDEH